MNLKQLEVFLAVADTGSFSRGAETAFLTQSTVSQHILALEQEFNIRFFDRTGKGALLTPGGKLLAKHARVVFREVREMELALKKFRGVEEVLLTVGGSNVPGNYMIPAALPLLAERYPGLCISLSQGDSRGILERISAGEIEVGVVGSLFSRDRFDVIPLGHDLIKLVVAPDHRWCGEKRLPLAALLDEPFVMRENGSGTRKTVDQTLADAGIDTTALLVKAILGSNEAVKQAVAGGVGIAFISDLSARKELERGDLVEVRVEGLTISRFIYLASRAGRILSPAAIAFASVMRDLYEEKPVAVGTRTRRER